TPGTDPTRAPVRPRRPVGAAAARGVRGADGVHGDGGHRPRGRPPQHRAPEARCARRGNTAVVTRVVARVTFYAMVIYMLGGALGSVVWWALDSGPLATDPRLVLNDPAASPAIRVYGDHPGLDPD